MATLAISLETLQRDPALAIDEAAREATRVNDQTTATQLDTLQTRGRVHLSRIRGGIIGTSAAVGFIAGASRFGPDFIRASESHDVLGQVLSGLLILGATASGAFAGAMVGYPLGNVFRRDYLRHNVTPILKDHDLKPLPSIR